VSHATLEKPKRFFRFEYGAITLYGIPFQVFSSTKKFSNFLQLKVARVFLTPLLIQRIRNTNNDGSPCKQGSPPKLTISNPRMEKLGFGLLPVRSPLLREYLPAEADFYLVSFPPATKMFQFAEFPPHYLYSTIKRSFSNGSPSKTEGFPHSEILE
jgi:hypothetical protein